MDQKQRKDWWVGYCCAVAANDQDRAIEFARQLGFNAVKAANECLTKAREWAQNIRPKTKGEYDKVLADLFLSDRWKKEGDFGWKAFCAASKDVGRPPSNQHELNSLYDTWARQLFDQYRYADWPFRAFAAVLDVAYNDHADDLKHLNLTASLPCMNDINISVRMAYGMARRAREVMLRDPWRKWFVAQYLLTASEYAAWKKEQDAIPFLTQKVKDVLPCEKGVRRRLQERGYHQLGTLVQVREQDLRRWFKPAEILNIKNALRHLGLRLAMPLSHALVQEFNRLRFQFMTEEEQIVQDARALVAMAQPPSLQQPQP